MANRLSGLRSIASKSTRSSVGQLDSRTVYVFFPFWILPANFLETFDDDAGHHPGLHISPSREPFTTLRLSHSVTALLAVRPP